MYLIAFLLVATELFSFDFDHVVPSSSDEIYSLSNDLLVEGCVSVSSGQLSICETDLKVKAAQDLVLQRIYIPPRIFGRYSNKEGKDRYFLIEELWRLKSKGFVTLPHLRAGYNRHSKYFQLTDPLGFTLEFKIKNGKGILKSSTFGCTNLKGETVTSFQDIRNIDFTVFDDLIKVTWPNGVQRWYEKGYRLIKEILPNGKAICYEYGKDSLLTITATNLSGTKRYASIDLINANHFKASNNLEVRSFEENYQLQTKCKINGVKTEHSSSFSLVKNVKNPYFENTIGYDERTMLSFYDFKSFPISCSYTREKLELARIETFSTPSGRYHFSYNPAIAGVKPGFTKVTHPMGNDIIYHFNKLLLLDSIENYNKGVLINKKVFSYDHKQHIQSIEIFDSQGSFLKRKRFECDNFGNAVLEVDESDLGTFAIRRRFDKNRLIFEEDDAGLQKAFSYLGDTHLVTSFSLLEKGKQLQKVLYFYDDSCNLICKEEVGKTKTFYSLYETGPHLDRVAWEEKLDYNGNLLHKVRYEYDAFGNTAKEDHYGSDGCFAYCITRIYDEKGQLLKANNPIGDFVEYGYDPRGRCVYEKPISNDLEIFRTFDEKGRLVRLQKGDHLTQFSYDAGDALIQKVDYLGFATTYVNDCVHKKPVLIDRGGYKTQICYDSFGREIEIIDPLNNKTRKTYNANGAVLEIIDPENNKESFAYYPNGLLKTHVNVDGIKNCYLYDALNRVVQKTVAGMTTTYEYEGLNLVKEIDAKNYVTFYKYDAEDRKTSCSREGRNIFYEYDALGFLSKIKQSGRIQEYENDFLGQIKSKTIDSVLKTSWTYDKAGNVTSVEKKGIKRFTFDAHNRLVQTIDEEGNLTNISYSIGDKVLYKKTIDPLNREILEVFNPNDQLLIKKINSKTVEEYEYDELFRLKKQDRITFGYTPNGNLKSSCIGEIRNTSYSYSEGNLVKAKQKPDGTVLVYSYNSQGLLTKMRSREFAYDELGRLISGSGFARVLDPFGNVLKESWSNGLWIETSFDELDRPVKRTLPDLSTITYDYQGPFLVKITRFSSNGNLVHAHSYDDFDALGNATKEAALFRTLHDYDLQGREIWHRDCFISEKYCYDAIGNILKKNDIIYTYDDLLQMTSESGKFHAVYDERFNLKELNGNSFEIDALDQIKGLNYNANGNLTKNGFIFDEFDQLVFAENESYIYDALGRRIQKGSTSFLYLDEIEIGAFENGKAKELQILGNKNPILIEINQKPYVPIVDLQGITRLLIDRESGKIFQKNDSDVFGSGVNDKIPYAYQGKRYCPKTGLIYFGKRFYDPKIRRWLTADPAGFIDSSNLYQFVYNNPYRFYDPNGESVAEYLLGLGEIALGGAIIAGGLGLELATFGGFTFALGATAGSGVALIGHGLYLTTSNAKDVRFSNVLWKGDQVESRHLTYKSGSIDPTLPTNPDDLLKRPGWKETTHSGAGKHGHRTFENEITGEKLRHDEGKPGFPGHKAYDHWHRPNPNKTNWKDEYLDGQFNPVPDGHDKSHIYSPEKIWWN